MLQYWSLFKIKLQASFYRTLAVATSGFSRLQIPFSGKSGMYWRQSHQFFSWTPLKTRAKPQKQPLELFCKKRSSQKFCKSHRKTSVLKSLFNRVAGLQGCNFIKKGLQHRYFPMEITKFLTTEVYERLLLKTVLSSDRSIHPEMKQKGCS